MFNCAAAEASVHTTLGTLLHLSAYRHVKVGLVRHSAGRAPVHLL